LIWTIIGAFISGLAFLVYQWLPIGEWRQVAILPVEGGSILAFGEWETLFITSDDDVIYECDLRKGICTQIPPNIGNKHPDLCHTMHRPVAKPPGNEIDSREFHLCGADVKVQLNYAILDDRTIWEWTEFSSWGDYFIIQTLCILGGIIGFIGGITYSLIRRRRIADSELAN
jgi:hypothetical protein